MQVAVMIKNGQCKKLISYNIWIFGTTRIKIPEAAEGDTSIKNIHCWH